MSTFQTILVFASSTATVNVLFVWFLHKASIRFRKMDNAVGNFDIR